MMYPINKHNIRKSLIAALLALSPVAKAAADHVVFHSPESFQVLSVSANGKWACGVFVDASMETFGFRWNLDSGDVEMLGSEVSMAWGIANDGTVSGEFPDTQVSPNGAPVTMPAFWRDGVWHHIEMPEGVEMEGIGCGISPDGHYMTGSVKVKGHYTPYIWKEGKIFRSLDTGKDAVSYAVSPDGQAAAGFSTQYNRTACYWDPDGEVTYFTDSPEYSQGPWNYCRNFSPDGKQLLYWGGWEPDGENEALYLYTVYNVETGERTRVSAPSYDSDLEFFDISNSGLLTGYSKQRGYVWTNGQCVVIDDYLASRGVDLTGYEDFYAGADYYVGQLPISRVVSVSADDSVFALWYYNQQGQVSSMIVKFADDFSLTPPASVEAQQLDGLSTVGITWKRPVGVPAIRGFNVYRDGKKISGFLPISVPYFYDKGLDPGTYVYEVATVNISGVETRSQKVTVTVTDQSLVRQQPLSAFSRQKGIDGALVAWDAPLSPLVHKHYFNPDHAQVSDFYVFEAVEVEMGVKYDKADIANYAGYKLSEVSFYPMAPHQDWSINVYSRDENDNLVLIHSQPVTQQLEYRKLNTVKIDSEVVLPNTDLIVAVSVMGDYDNQATIGAHNGIVTPGYSDLLRMTFEDDFYSAFERSAAQAMSISCLAWAIDLGFEAPDADTAAQTVEEYRVYVDGEPVGNTDATSFVAESLSSGEHLFGVEAVYPDGSVSPMALTAVNVAVQYPKISEVEVVTTDDSGVISASWKAPVDNDLTDISYVTAKHHYSGIKGVESNGYALMARVDYPASMFRGYDGYKVKSFRFYPLADALFAMILFEDGVKIYDIDIDEFTVGQWNEVMLPDDVEIKSNHSYSLILDCFDPVPDVQVVAIDNAMPRPYTSDLYSIDNGDSWNSFSLETGSSGNWMMGFTIVDPQERPVIVDGYDLVVDNVRCNESAITATEYSHDMGVADGRRHWLRIDTYYPALAEAVTGEVTYFRLPSGLADDMIADISIRQGQNWLIAEGDGITAIKVNSLDGRTLAAAQAAQVEISSLPAGIYIVQVYAGSAVTTRKVNIKH